MLTKVILRAVRGLVCIALYLAATSVSFAAGRMDDLSIPESRVPVWYAFDESVYQAARTWPEFDVTCGSEPCTSGRRSVRSIVSTASCASLVTTSTLDRLDCFVDTAPSNVVLYLPAGTFTGQYAASISRDDIVVRGAGRASTTLYFTSTQRDANLVAGCDLDSATNGFSVCHGNYRGQSVAWTAGYSAGTSVVTVSNASAFPPGSWVLLDMKASGCSLTYADPFGTMKYAHIAQVTARSGNSLTLDRPLRMGYAAAGCTGQSASLFSPVRNVGIESLRLTSNPSIPVCGEPPSGTCHRWPPVMITGCVGCWVTDSKLDRSDDDWIGLRFSARLWIQGNDFDDLNLSIVFNTEGINIQQAVVDAVIENNTCARSNVCTKLDIGGNEGIVVSYNYLHNGSSNCERSSMIHGGYNREHLFEGNDANCEMMLDIWWGSNGPGITFYRNRHSGSTCNDKGNLGVNDDVGPAGLVLAGSQTNWIGNTAMYYGNTAKGGNQSCPVTSDEGDANGIASRIASAWAEKNAYRDAGGFSLFDKGTATNGRSCGTGSGDACPGTNKFATAPDPSWSGIYPTSLYRSAGTAPTWWCQEACPWSQAGIGAFGDDFNRGLCQLPAQIRAGGGTCTPMGAGGSQGPPLAPTLLP